MEPLFDELAKKISPGSDELKKSVAPPLPMPEGLREKIGSALIDAYRKMEKIAESYGLNLDKRAQKIFLAASTLIIISGCAGKNLRQEYERPFQAPPNATKKLTPEPPKVRIVKPTPPTGKTKREPAERPSVPMPPKVAPNPQQKIADSKPKPAALKPKENPAPKLEPTKANVVLPRETSQEPLWGGPKEFPTNPQLTEMKHEITTTLYNETLPPAVADMLREDLEGFAQLEAFTNMQKAGYTSEITVDTLKEWTDASHAKLRQDYYGQLNSETYEVGCQWAETAAKFLGKKQEEIPALLEHPKAKQQFLEDSANRLRKEMADLLSKTRMDEKALKAAVEKSLADAVGQFSPEEKLSKEIDLFGDRDTPLNELLVNKLLDLAVQKEIKRLEEEKAKCLPIRTSALIRLHQNTAARYQEHGLEELAKKPLAKVVKLQKKAVENQERLPELDKKLAELKGKEQLVKTCIRLVLLEKTCQNYKSVFDRVEDLTNKMREHGLPLHQVSNPSKRVRPPFDVKEPQRGSRF